MSMEEAKKYTPSKGVNVKWHSWNKDRTEVIAEFLCSDKYVWPGESQTKEKIDKEIDVRLASRVVKGNIANPKNVITPLTLKWPTSDPVLKMMLPKSKADDFKSLEKMTIPNAGLQQANKNLIMLSQLHKRLRQKGLADKRIKPLRKNEHTSVVELGTLENRI